MNTSQSDGEMCGRPHGNHKFEFSFVGKIVTRGEFPWLVAIYLNKKTGPLFHCGGNLVSARIAVTAASCFRTAERTHEANEIVLVLGRHNILQWAETGWKEFAVEKLIVHSDYLSKDTPYDADIAIAIIRDRVEFTEYIQPICLWEAKFDHFSIVEVQAGTIVGWGRGDTGNIVRPEPKKISIPFVSQTECLRSSNIFRNITSKRTFCAGSRDGRGPCNGDEGDGMAFQVNDKWFLRGIVSGFLFDPITHSCNLDEYFVLTDVAKFVDWIKSYMS